MAECGGGCAGCEHCQDRVEPDAYAPTGPSVAHVSSGCPVRDLSDAIRAIAVANVVSPAETFATAVRDALAIVRQVDVTHADGTNGCDVCRRLREVATRPTGQRT